MIREARVQRFRDTASRVAGCAALACIIAAILLAGCDESFSPIASSAFKLSVFGYLDASADTQWVRLTSIHPSS